VLSMPLGIAHERVRRGRGATRDAEPVARNLDRPQCIWCWAERPDHEPKDCVEKQKVDMSDFKQGRVTRQRSAASASKSTAKHGKVQTSRTPDEQKAHEARYDIVFSQRRREMIAAAKQKLQNWLLLLQRKREEDARPLAGNGPFGQFTTYQLLALEFASQMQEHVPAETMQKPPVTLNSSCVQRFTNLLTKPVGKAPFKSIADVRCSSEPAISDFVRLRTQLQSSPCVLVRSCAGPTCRELPSLVAGRVLIGLQHRCAVCCAVGDDVARLSSSTAQACCSRLKMWIEPRICGLQYSKMRAGQRMRHGCCVDEVSSACCDVLRSHVT
jgi:hypothetical protein